MDELIPLSLGALSRIPAAIGAPRYDRQALSPGIVHIGLGNFHRAHMAWYTHRLMQAGQALDWAIVGGGVRPADAAMRERLAAQDWLTTLIELDPAGATAEVTGAMIGFAPVEPDNAALIAQMADPAIRIVSLTVTEGGYYVDPATGGLDLDHPDIRHDAAHPEAPRTAFGAIVAALRRRRGQGAQPFTAMSCDNLSGNGDILRRAVVTLARQSDPALADWIEAQAAFPNTMVDCIVPATGPREIALARDFGIADAAPVTHEPFRQWVLEDSFCAGRPPWEAAGAQFTDDLHGYEAQKLRILNAGHQVIANVAELQGIETIADAMAAPPIRALFGKVQHREIVPHVRPVPGMSPTDYVALIETRFANPAIRDTVRRVAFDGSSRHPGFVLPSLRDALAAGAPFDGLALVEALWARMCTGVRENGDAIAPNDPQWSSLTQAAQAARTQPGIWLAQASIYGDLGQHAAFSARFAEWLRLLWAEGSTVALKRYIEAF